MKKTIKDYFDLLKAGKENEKLEEKILRFFRSFPNIEDDGRIQKSITFHTNVYPSIMLFCVAKVKKTPKLNGLNHNGLFFYNVIINVSKIEESEIPFDINWNEYDREFFDDEIEEIPFDDFIEGIKQYISKFLKKIS